MKSLLNTLLILVAFAFAGQVNAQGTFVDDLNDVIDGAKDARDAAKGIRSALKTLTVDYFQLNNPTPNTAAYIATSNNGFADVEDAFDIISDAIAAAAAKNPQISTTTIDNLNDIVVDRVDAAAGEAFNLVNQINANNRSAARASAKVIRGLLNEAIQAAKAIIDEANALKTLPGVFNVRIVLEDAAGNPVGSNGIQGFFATEVGTNNLIWAGAQQGQDPYVFTNLPGGTYIFDGVQGYFDGVSSTQATISSSSPTNGAGEVEVTLIYWSE